MSALFESQTLTFSNSGGVYLATVAMFGLTAGQEYTVVFDGTEYRMTAVEMVQSGVHYIVLGNPNLVWLGDDNGDQFAVADAVELGTGYVSTKNAPTTHTVAIYEAVTVILPKTTKVFEYNSAFGCFSSHDLSPTFQLEAGKEYRVVWDSDDVVRVGLAFTNPNDGTECVYVGNPMAAGQTPNDDSFCIVHDVTNNYVHYFSLTQYDVHTIAIYQLEEADSDPGGEAPEEPDEPTEPEQPEGIILKDRNGKDVAYYGIETVTFDTTTEGKQQVYTKGVAVEGLEIVPDFSNGDMAVAAGIGELIRSAIIKDPTEEVIVDLNMADGDQIIVPTTDGKVISKVTVKKPDTFREENIAGGVNIGGLIGALAGAKFSCGKSGSGSSGSAQRTIEHGLGCVPDIIMAYSAIDFTSGTQYIKNIFAMSSALTDKIGHTQWRQIGAYNSPSASKIYMLGNWSSITDTDDTKVINSANAETFVLGSTTTYARGEMYWIAIGGLT